MPVGLAHQLMACHWLSLGMEIEATAAADLTDHLGTFEQLCNREHSWQLEPH
jgi:hypothetical protein